MTAVIEGHRGHIRKHNPAAAVDESWSSLQRLNQGLRTGQNPGTGNTFYRRCGNIDWKGIYIYSPSITQIIKYTVADHIDVIWPWRQHHVSVAFYSRMVIKNVRGQPSIIILFNHIGDKFDIFSPPPVEGSTQHRPLSHLPVPWDQEMSYSFISTVGGTTLTQIASRAAGTRCSLIGEDWRKILLALKRNKPWDRSLFLTSHSVWEFHRATQMLNLALS